MLSSIFVLAGYLIGVWVSFKLANRKSEPGNYHPHDNSDLKDLLKWATRLGFNSSTPVHKPPALTPRIWWGGGYEL